MFIYGQNEKYAFRKILITDASNSAALLKNVHVVYYGVNDTLRLLSDSSGTVLFKIKCGIQYNVFLKLDGYYNYNMKDFEKKDSCISKVINVKLNHIRIMQD